MQSAWKKLSAYMLCESADIRYITSMWLHSSDQRC